MRDLRYVSQQTAIPSDLHLSNRPDRHHAVCHLNIIGGTAAISNFLPPTADPLLPAQLKVSLGFSTPTSTLLQMRQLADLRTVGWPYHQRGLVATVRTEPQNTTALQRFLETGLPPCDHAVHPANPRQQAGNPQISGRAKAS